MFPNCDGTEFVHVLLTVEPSSSTPHELLDQLSFYHSVPGRSGISRVAEIDVSDYFYGNNWRDHIRVLGDLVDDDVATLQKLAFADAKVSVTLRWVGAVRSTVPQLTPNDLGRIFFPGMHITLECDWNYGNHIADMGLVSFCVYGPDPDRVSEFLGDPSRVVYKGDEIVTRGKVRGHRKRNAWILEARDGNENFDIFEKLESMLSHLGPPSPEWRLFVKSTSAQVDIRVVWYGASGQTVPIFSHDILKKISAYGANIFFESADFVADMT